MTINRDIAIVGPQQKTERLNRTRHSSAWSLSWIGQKLLNWFLALLLAAPLVTSGSNALANFGPQEGDPFAVGGDNQDPFGGGQDDNPFASGSDSQTPAAPVTTPDSGDLPEIDESLSVATQLIIKTLRKSAPSTDLELARAVRTMMNVAQWEDAKYYLGKLAAQCTEDARLFDLYQHMGADYFLELHAESVLGPTARPFALSAMTAARKVAYSPERIAALTGKLNDSNRAVRSDAFRALRRLGAPAAAALVNVFADDSREKEFPGIRGALRNMGRPALEPLLGAIRSDNQNVREEAIRGLATINETPSTDALLWAYRNEGLSEPVRRIAADALISRFGKAIDYNRAEDRLYKSAYELLVGKAGKAGLEDSVLEVWRWDPSAKMLISKQIPKETARSIAAADRAADLYSMSPANPRNRILYLLTQLEAAKRLGGPSVKVNVENLVAQFSQQSTLNTGELESVLTQALKLGRMPAAAAACEMLGASGSADILMGTDRKYRPLVGAMLCGDRHVQFAALDAIMTLDPAMAYGGSSHATALAVYLASSQGKPKGLVGHNRVDVAQSFAAVLNQTGVAGIGATNSRDMYKTAVSDPDIEMLLITDSLNYPRFAELAQQLRADWRTKRIPIGLVLNDSLNQRRIRHIMDADPRMIALPMTLDPELVRTQIERLRRLEDTWQVSLSDRQRHAERSLDWLAKISSDRESYPFYNLGEHQQALSKLLYKEGFSARVGQILADLGTPKAQRELLNYASLNDLPVAQRQAAVDAFARSVQASGTLLTGAEIQLQYDRYNASRNEPEETQKILGAVLDVIETRAKESASSD